MAQKPTHHVLPSDDGWKVKPEGGSRATSVHSTQAYAVAAATARARERGQGSVVIRRPDGRIREERTFGEDPPESKG